MNIFFNKNSNQIIGCDTIQVVSQVRRFIYESAERTTMDFEKNIKYFNSTDTLFYIGIPIFAIGAILVLCELFWFWFMPYQIFIGLILAAIGAGLAFIPRSKRANEKDLDAIVSSITENYDKKVIEELNIQKQLLRNIAPLIIGNYVYGEKDLLMRQGKDDRRWRTSRYSTAAILCTKNGMVVSHKTFSLIEESETEALHEIFYSDIDMIFVDDKYFLLDDGTKIKNSELIITQKDETELRLPLLHIVAVDNLCEDIHRILSTSQS